MVNNMMYATHTSNIISLPVHVFTWTGLNTHIPGVDTHTVTLLLFSWPCAHHLLSRLWRDPL